jgi:hypothetical protein
MGLGLTGCAAQKWDSSAIARSYVEHAASRTLHERSAFLRGTFTSHGTAIVSFTGAVNFAGDQADVSTVTFGSGLLPSDARWVSGWTYVEMPPGQQRPPTVRRSAQWLAFHVRRYRGAIPVPGETIYPGLPTQMLSDLVAGNFTVHRVPSPNGLFDAYRVSHLASATRGVTVLIQSGEVVGFDSTSNPEPRLQLTPIVHEFGVVEGR